MLFGINAFCTVVGVVLNSINLEKFKKLSLVLYIIMGWSALFVCAPILKLVAPAGIVFLVAGGLSYTLGVIFYKLPKYKYMHSVWHIFVLAGSVLQYFFMLFYTLKV